MQTYWGSDTVSFIQSIICFWLQHSMHELLLFKKSSFFQTADPMTLKYYYIPNYEATSKSL